MHQRIISGESSIYIPPPLLLIDQILVNHTVDFPFISDQSILTSLMKGTWRKKVIENPRVYQNDHKLLICTLSVQCY